MPIQLLELDKIRLDAYTNSALYKERMKKIHDNMIKTWANDTSLSIEVQVHKMKVEN